MRPNACHLTDQGLIESVNVGAVRTVEWRGQRVTTGIWKAPLSGRVRVQGVNIHGDNQADRTVHGGSDKAVYAYASEDYDWWSYELGYALEPGTFGENLTVRGMPVSDGLVGECWRIGSVVLEVSQPRLPCYKLGMRMNDARFPRRFAAAGRPGAYLRIVEPGELASGDPIEVVHRPGHNLTVGDVAHIYLRDHHQVDRLLQVPELPEEWRHWARALSMRRGT
jgi:MOSC domain-containing protein YiiM